MYFGYGTRVIQVKGKPKMRMTQAERDTAQQLLANGWSPAKIARAFMRARRRNSGKA